MYHPERRNHERPSQKLFEALVSSAARRAAESDEILDNLYRRLCLKVGDTVLTKGSAIIGAICATAVLVKWDELKQWLM